MGLHCARFLCLAITLVRTRFLCLLHLTQNVIHTVGLVTIKPLHRAAKCSSYFCLIQWFLQVFQSTQLYFRFFDLQGYTQWVSLLGIRSAFVHLLLVFVHWDVFDICALWCIWYLSSLINCKLLATKPGQWVLYKLHPYEEKERC